MNISFPYFSYQHLLSDRDAMIADWMSKSWLEEIHSQAQRGTKKRKRFDAIFVVIWWKVQLVDGLERSNAGRLLGNGKNLWEPNGVVHKWRHGLWRWGGQGFCDNHYISFNSISVTIGGNGKKICVIDGWTLTILLVFFYVPSYGLFFNLHTTFTCWLLS